jgi:aconitate hydratase
VIAESYERIHRSNLVGMGILPLQYLSGDTAASLGLTGRETLTISGIADGLRPHQELMVTVGNGSAQRSFRVVARLDGEIDVTYLRNGGVLQTVLRRLAT